MELYHVLNRGVDGRVIFLDTADHARFVHCLFEFNADAPAIQTGRRANNPAEPMSDLRSRTSARRRLVDIHGWCLVRNHYHLLLSERVEDGLNRFSRKLNIGYAKYFNAKYERKGALFQGRTKKVPIASDGHFNYILHYIHLNALDTVGGAEDWRLRDKTGIRDLRAAQKQLAEYRWSSYLDYAGKKNFPSILTTDLFGNAFGEYQKAIVEYLEDSEMVSASELEF